MLHVFKSAVSQPRLFRLVVSQGIYCNILVEMCLTAACVCFLSYTVHMVIASIGLFMYAQLCVGGAIGGVL